MALSSPATLACTTAVLAEAMLPIASTTTGRSRRCTAATDTGCGRFPPPKRPPRPPPAPAPAAGGEAPLPAPLPPPSPRPFSHQAPSPTIATARATSTHVLALPV